MIDYSWVPWFRELAHKIAEGGEAVLVENARAVDWQVDKPALLEQKDDSIDPFSFLYSVASHLGDDKFMRRLGSVHDVFSIETACPQYPPLIPRGLPHNLLFYKDGDRKPSLLWELFRQASDDPPAINGDDFNRALQISNVAIAKVTQTLYIINAEHFLPADDTAKALPWPEFERRPKDYEEYVTRLDTIKQLFPGCMPYEINTFLYKQADKKKPLMGTETNFFQVSTDVYNDDTDHWAKFDCANSVWTQAGKSPADTSCDLENAERGDVILVRFGSSGRGIGVVEKNGYADVGSSEDARISVYWVNKRDTQLANVTRPHGSELVPTEAVTGTAALPLIDGQVRSATYANVGPYTPEPKQDSIIATLYEALNAAGGTAIGNSLVSSVMGFVRPTTGEPMSESDIAGTLRWLVQKERLHVLPPAQQQPRQ